MDANGNPIYSLGYAEKILKGWGTRPSDWQIGVTLQQEILLRVSLEVGLLPPLAPELHCHG